MTIFKLASLKRSLSEIEESCTKRLKSEEVKSKTAPPHLPGIDTTSRLPESPKLKRKAEDIQETSKRPKVDFVVEKMNTLSLTDPKENKLQLVHVKPIQIHIPPVIFSSLQVEDVTEEYERNAQLQVVKYTKPIYQ